MTDDVPDFTNMPPPPPPERRFIRNLSFVKPFRENPALVEIGLNAESGHFRIVLSRATAHSLGIRSIAAASEQGAVVVSTPNAATVSLDGKGGLVLSIQLGLEALVHVALTRSGAIALAQDLTSEAHQIDTPPGQKGPRSH